MVKLNAKVTNNFSWELILILFYEIETLSNHRGTQAIRPIAAFELALKKLDHN
jgi:hypothetical protein